MKSFKFRRDSPRTRSARFVKKEPSAGACLMRDQAAPCRRLTPPHSPGTFHLKLSQQEQWEKIKTALAANGGQAHVLIRHFGVARPSELPADRFGEAMELAGKPPCT
jgi:hypothetical protein